MVRNILPKLSWSTENSKLREQLIEEGIFILEDIGIETPTSSIKNTFRKIYGDLTLAKRLNAVYPVRGIFKDDSRKAVEHVDQKVPFDLSPARLSAIVDNDKDLVQDLGDDFLKILSFYNIVQERVISRLIRLTEEGIAGCEINNHKEMNFNYRLVDYYNVEQESTRCREHRDYGTFTLIFQDDSIGGLEVFRNESWVPVPANAGVIFLWGWSAAILSNGRIQPPLQRVATISDGQNMAPQRNSAIFFVAPDLDVKLTPRLLPDENMVFNPEVVRDLTVRDFKAIMDKTWRYREGTLTTEEQAELIGKSLGKKSQDDEILEFLRKPTI